MNDHQTTLSISSSQLGAFAFGCLAIVFVTLNFFRDDEKLGFVGMLCAAAGIIFRVRWYFCLMTQREQTAFTLGEESARVQSLR